MDDCSQSQTTRPFLAAPEPSRYFPATSIEEARKKIHRSIERGEGPALLIGASGTGKTLLLEVFARLFDKKLEVVSLAGAQLCTRRALLQSILFQLNLPYRDLDEGELRLSLIDYLKPRAGQAHRLLLLVDEADSLATRLLEELRALSNLSARGELLVNLVLAGSAALEERFAEPELDVFSQRVSQRCYLAPLGREETLNYVRAQIAASKLDEDLFAAEALDAVFAATDGLPRLINQLCDQLVWLSQETGYNPLDAAIVQQAWSEIQQLPAPWNLDTKAGSSSVEFGSLASEPEEDAAEEADDLPALLPISIGKQFESPERVTEEQSEAARIEEVLVDEFEMMIEEEPNAPAPSSRNPFGEEFQHEEFVFDRYLEFEVQMLAGAPRVINRLDSAFAQQLKDLETQLGDQAVVTPDEPPSAPVPAELEPVASTLQELDSDSASYAEEVNEADNEVSEEDSEPLLVGVDQGDAEANDILVVEDDRPRKISIVSGRNFRQLFSSLETGS